MTYSVGNNNKNNNNNELCFLSGAGQFLMNGPISTTNELMTLNKTIKILNIHGEQKQERLHVIMSENIFC